MRTIIQFTAAILSIVMLTACQSPKETVVLNGFPFETINLEDYTSDQKDSTIFIGISGSVVEIHYTNNTVPEEASFDSFKVWQATNENIPVSEGVAAVDQLKKEYEEKGMQVVIYMGDYIPK